MLWIFYRYARLKSPINEKELTYMLHFGALEAGGTKMVCAVGNAQGQILERISLPTRDPENTMPEILAFFREKQVSAVGVGCFGPVDLDRNSPTYGNITAQAAMAKFPHAAPLPGGSGGARGL
jgi:predicted NBD/HSP70 family sugar kinase